MTEDFLNASKLINYLFEKKYVLEDNGTDNTNWQKPSGSIPYYVRFAVANKEKFSIVSFEIVTRDNLDLVRKHNLKLLNSKLKLKKEDLDFIYNNFASKKSE